MSELDIHHRDIVAWANCCDEAARLEKREARAADVWLESLSAQQRTVFFQLLMGKKAVDHLRGQAVMEELEARKDGREPSVVRALQ